MLQEAKETRLAMIQDEERKKEELIEERRQRRLWSTPPVPVHTDNTLVFEDWLRQVEALEQIRTTEQDVKSRRRRRPQLPDPVAYFSESWRLFRDYNAASRRAMSLQKYRTLKQLKKKRIADDDRPIPVEEKDMDNAKTLDKFRELQ